MPPSLINEPLVLLSRAAQFMPPGMPPPDAATVYRWAHRGARGVRLAAVRRGGRWFTSARAVREFLAETSGEAAPAAAAVLA
jgi:hypothetical protein